MKKTVSALIGYFQVNDPQLKPWMAHQASLSIIKSLNIFPHTMELSIW